MLGFIPDDGYTIDGYFCEVPGLHPALRFRFRPLTVEAFAAIMAKARHEANPNHLFARTIAARVETWDLRDAKGEAVAVSEKIALSLVPRLFDRLFDVVTGQKPHDIDPAIHAAPQDAETEAIVAAALSGRSVGAAREETDEKN